MNAKRFIQDIIDGKLRGAEARRVAIQLFGKNAELTYEDIPGIHRIELDFEVTEEGEVQFHPV